jgi:hypothetical protein
VWAADWVAGSGDYLGIWGEAEAEGEGKLLRVLDQLIKTKLRVGVLTKAIRNQRMLQVRQQDNTSDSDFPCPKSLE